MTSFNAILSSNLFLVKTKKPKCQNQKFAYLIELYAEQLWSEFPTITFQLTPLPFSFEDIEIDLDEQMAIFQTLDDTNNCSAYIGLMIESPLQESALKQMIQKILGYDLNPLPYTHLLKMIPNDTNAAFILAQVAHQVTDNIQEQGGRALYRQSYIAKNNDKAMTV